MKSKQLIGIPSHLQRTYERLYSRRRLVSLRSGSYIVYLGSLNGMEDDVVGLVQLRAIERKRLGRCRVVVLGTWSVAENLLAEAKILPSRFFDEGMVKFLSRYDIGQQTLIDQAFEAFARLRRSRNVASNILFKQLQSWSRFPASAVEEGLRRYLEGGHVDQGRGERYALGIVRGCAREVEIQKELIVRTPVVSSVDSREESVRIVRERARRVQEEVDKLAEQFASSEFGCSLNDLSPRVVADLIRRARSQLSVS